MLLKSGTIYKRSYFADSYMLPSIQINGTAKIYVSNAGEQPSSTDEMLLEENFKDNKINVVTAMTRWICAVYDDSDEANAVYEMGIVENPYKG